MKTVALIFILLSGLFTVKPLVMMNIATVDTCNQEATCNKECGKEAPSKETANKNCDTTTRCNTSACCFVCQYLPVEEPSYKSYWLSSAKKSNPRYTEKPVSGYSTDCWQPPEVVLI